MPQGIKFFLDVHYVLGLNDQMNSKKQEILNSDRMKELRRCHGVINDRYIE